MDFAGINSTSQQASISGSRTTIAENFEAFLSLLTTQLKNQNPLEPLDTDSFTQQLVQFTEVEQSLKQNVTLEGIQAQLANQQTLQATSYVGSNVTASGVRTQLDNGRAEWRYDASAPGQANINVLDAGGNVVWSEQRNVSQGDGAFVWDGRTFDGSTLPDGLYSVQMSGQGIDENPISLSTEIVGRVSEVRFTAGGPTLIVNGARIPLSSIRSIVS